MVGTMLEQCGGYSRVAQMVFVFYDRVLQSPRLRSFFVGVDMRRLIEHQTKLLCSLMEGPVRWLGLFEQRFRLDKWSVCRG
jgi:hemoglobin